MCTVSGACRVSRLQSSTRRLEWGSGSSLSEDICCTISVFYYLWKDLSASEIGALRDRVSCMLKSHIFINLQL
ncbi:hypothetical protein AAC387_Pa06g0592 [Persea americana]